MIRIPSSIAWIQGYAYNHVILTLTHPDMFSQVEEKEAALQGLLEAP